jgi:hypothetical protein
VAPNLVLVIALAGVVVGAALAAAMIARLVRIGRRPELARVPIVPEIAVAFAEAGPAELAVEGPRFTTKLGALSFQLLDPGGTAVALHRIWMRTSASGVASVRLARHRLALPIPGTYALRTTGIDPAIDYDGCAVVFVRPSGSDVVATIVALLGSIALAAGGAATVGALFVGDTRPGDAQARSAVAALAPATPASKLDTPTPAVPDASASGGRRLASDPARLERGKDLLWQDLQMHVRVPTEWVVRKVSTTELDLRDPATPSTFLIARASPMPAGPSIDDFLQADLVRAQESLAARRIDGYAVRRIGPIGGMLTLERRSGGTTWLASWTGYQPAELGSLSVTLLAGATAADFARDEALLGAVVDSIRFE